MNRHIKNSILYLICAVALGAAAGFIIGRNDTAAIIIAKQSSDKISLDIIKEYMLTYCKSTVIQASLIYISGLTLYPKAIYLPVMIYRGFSIGYAVNSCLRTDTSLLILLASYILVSAVLIPLCLHAERFRENKSEHAVKKTLSYSYVYLMINGASIVITLLPHLIAEKMI